MYKEQPKSIGLCKTWLKEKNEFDSQNYDTIINVNGQSYGSSIIKVL